MKKILSVAEVASLLNVSERALRQRIARRQFPARRWGRRVVILSAELDGFLDALPGASTAAVLRQGRYE